MTLSSSAGSVATILYLSLAGLVGFAGHAQAQPAPRFKAVAFDYFVIFDANSIVPEIEKARTITGRFADFSAVTEDALVYAAEAMHLELKGDTRRRLLAMENQSCG
jgi:2-haloacid dehalogenase